MPTATRKCCGCKERYPVETMTKFPRGWFCKLQCAVDHATKKAREATKRAADKTKREKIRQDKERVKTRSEWLREAQTAFNHYIRLRDKALPCISCGRYHAGQYHAGHYRTVGSHPELRFCELNVHKQCAPCNNHKSGNIVEYRINLVTRIGEDRLAWLEGPHEPKKYTIDEIKEIKAKYKRMASELSKL